MVPNSYLIKLDRVGNTIKVLGNFYLNYANKPSINLSTVLDLDSQFNKIELCVNNSEEDDYILQDEGISQLDDLINIIDPDGDILIILGNGNPAPSEVDPIEYYSVNSINIIRDSDEINHIEFSKYSLIILFNSFRYMDDISKSDTKVIYADSYWGRVDNLDEELNKYNFKVNNWSYVQD